MSDEQKNVFQIWRDLGEVLPFKVRRWSWHSSTYFLVKRVVIKKFPYGDAFGDMYLRGVLTDRDTKLGCAGCYQWVLV